MMSTGNAMSDTLDEVLDAAAAESDAGKLDDAEIQRLVALSRDASYRRTERVPVKSVEAFEPRSLVSIAMAAQRRREEEMSLDAAAAETTSADRDVSPNVLPTDGNQSTDDDATELGTTGQDADRPFAEGDMPPVQSAGGQDMAPADDESAAGNAQTGEGQADATLADEAKSGDAPAAGMAPNVDFEAGHASGLEEGRKVGFDEGHAKGMDEGRDAGRSEASAHLERAIQAFEVAAAKLGGLAEIDGGALSKSINDVVLSLASERAGHAIEALPDAFAMRIEKLVGTIRTVTGTPVIRLNAADLAAIAPLVETREKLRHYSFVEDHDMVRGDLSVTLGTIGIDDILAIDSPKKDWSEKGKSEEGATNRNSAEDAESDMAVVEDLQSDADLTQPSNEAEDGPTE